MKANNEPVIIADAQERGQFLKAVLIQSQIQEAPIEESVLRQTFGPGTGKMVSGTVAFPERI